VPFLSPNQSCQSTEGNISHSMDLLTLSLPGVCQLCLWPLVAPSYLGVCCHASHQPSDASTYCLLSADGTVLHTSSWSATKLFPETLCFVGSVLCHQESCFNIFNQRTNAELPWLFPWFMLDSNLVQFTSENRYLVNIFSSTLWDDKNIQRETCYILYITKIDTVKRFFPCPKWPVLCRMGR